MTLGETLLAVDSLKEYLLSSQRTYARLADIYMEALMHLVPEVDDFSTVHRAILDGYPPRIDSTTKIVTWVPPHALADKLGRGRYEPIRKPSLRDMIVYITDYYDVGQH